MRLLFLMGVSPFFAAGCLAGSGVTSGEAVLPLVGDGKETAARLDKGGQAYWIWSLWILVGLVSLLLVDGRPSWLSLLEHPC